MIKGYKGILPKIHPTVYIDDSAIIIGDVEIGKGSSIWCNVVIRGDVNYIRIGERTNVQDNSVLHVTLNTHPLIIGDAVTIGHNVTLHGCTIRGRCLIGMGAIILDGAEINEDVIIGAGSLVTEGTVIPPRTLCFGSPARPVRGLKEEEVERIVRSSENYMRYAASYMKGEDLRATDERGSP